MTETHAAAHHKIKTIKRSEGHSSVAKAAYIMRTKLQDERTGEWHDYRKKPGLIEAGQFNWDSDASSLWNATERAETNKDGTVKANAVVARESVYALPADLPPEVRKRLVIGMCLFKRDRYGAAGTWALHEPDEGGDQRNFHAHVEWTTRAVDADGNFSKTKIRVLDDRKATIPLQADGTPALDKKERPLNEGNYDPLLDENGKPVKISQGSYEIEILRQEWAKRVNRELEKAGIKVRVDHRGTKRRIAAGDAPATLLAEKKAGRSQAGMDRATRNLESKIRKKEERTGIKQKRSETHLARLADLKKRDRKAAKRREHNERQWAMHKRMNYLKAALKIESAKVSQAFLDVMKEQSRDGDETDFNNNERIR